MYFGSFIELNFIESITFEIMIGHEQFPNEQNGRTNAENRDFVLCGT